MVMKVSVGVRGAGCVSGATEYRNRIDIRLTSKDYRLIQELDD
ncbi:MAG: hypothetical protein ACN6QT_04150 [Burkholderia contaminans]|uniref:Uncharacterized protein n=1 Tax=Burkholderia contaminans TaxID=488447 RepID=A0AAP4QW97_9BURK|nr:MULTISPECIES: hypothetical protein [Burkholderia]MDN7562940.1 hypothetical protein [Burkholderia contaminans]MDN8019503.1 hypothetical protein [Burkholderia contaminans]UXZ70226.1 hypothetical protein NUJ29_32150 [Burkholderia contaminans]UXZ76932.1 hypothetical protein NUJ30_26550 [Burkholderia contaminans]